ncbi:MAG: AMP-binding protein [Pseudolabrys sp.]
MILPDAPSTDARTTLDDLFRRAAVRHPDALALADPPNRVSFTDGIPRSLTYAEADRIISAIAKRLRQFGLQTDAVVALQLPNTVESVLTLLGILRAGMIAALLPLLWRKADMVAALTGIGSRMLITAARVGRDRPCDGAMATAAGLFSIRYVGAFGNPQQDGVVVLDEALASEAPAVFPAILRSGNPAAHAAVLTWDVTAAGPVAIARNHAQLIAGGLAVFLEAGIENDSTILAAIPSASFAGIATTIVPWLLSGGTLALHHPFDAETFASQCAGIDDGTVVLPGPLADRLRNTSRGTSGPKNIVALWRAPECAVISERSPCRTDVTAFGETGLVATRRTGEGIQTAIPCGTISAPRGTPAAVPVIETMRTGAGTLALRGPMVSPTAFPPRAQPEAAPGEGFVDTAYPCRFDRARNTLTVTGPQPGMTAVGGYRFAQRWLDALVAELSWDATIVVLPDPLTGQRLAGSAPEPAAIQARLAETGRNPLIGRAFVMRTAAS